MTTLPTRMLPRTRHALTTLGMGGAPLGNMYDLISEDASRAAFDAAWAAGIRFFDTAPFYGYTLSERRFGEALREHPRDQWVLSSKVGRLLKPLSPHATRRELPAGETAWQNPLPFEVHYDYSAGAIRRSVEDSLQRLGTNRLDLALVHDIGRVTHGDRHDFHWRQLTSGGGLREMEALRREGLIGAIGLGVNEWEIVRDTMEHVDLDCTLLAGRYTLLEQQALDPFLARCVERGVGIIVGGPFNSGILAAGLRRPSSTLKFNYAAAPAEVLGRVARLQAVCDGFEVPLAAAALQFPLGHPAVVSCVPGPRNADELNGIVRWMTQPIPAALWAALREQGLIAADAPVPAGTDR
ncbi:MULTISPECIES: aldo/keto reductase [unclassified Rhizobacter]|uniref:aldo/keto reductase n=1 Tax=unclassified Rhizobacter TaxID=2640088 RepID=UPI0006F2344A|nr:MULTISPECIES: aldo/keto reductase [unclassified Rhizobacter]KQU78582.1 pyridoxal 4-dehydrogenase [Rhizobacter sp. Root29]KQW16113.1 pyridoxal 4-dehydrogenase [Rhizobacter sp. Root1238]KRB25451.1 pyridoxal 4-dehydrogenase [Rhizobacter sp. Root16D2]